MLEYKMMTRRIVFTILVGLVFWPLVFLWALTYGIIGGFFFKLIGSIEDLNCLIVEEIRQWKRFPRRHYEEYIEWQRRFDEEHRKNDSFNRPRNVEQLKEAYPDDPFPWARIVIHWSLTLIIFPFRCMFAMIQGPFVVFSDALFFWNERILKTPTLGKYKKLLNLRREYEGGTNEDYDWRQAIILITGGLYGK